MSRKMNVAVVGATGQVGGVTNQLATATAVMPLFDEPELGMVV